MKKLFIAALLVAGIGSSAFALDANKVNARVQNSFESRFANASNVKWTARGTYDKVSFTQAGENVEAFFTSEGELMGFSRDIAFKNLPAEAIKTIGKKYNAYQVKETIEVEQNDEKSYYVSLEKGTQKKVLQVTVDGAVTIFNGMPRQ